MQYTLRNVPPELDDALREKARAEGRSLNEVAIDMLREAFGLSERPARVRDLGDIVGTWEADEETERALEDQRGIDEALWR